MKTWQIKLTPQSPLFQGFPASDTLFGAICWGIKRIYGESRLLEILNGFQKKPAFILSSAFPYLESNGSILPFYQKPVSAGLCASDIAEMVGADKKKKVKVITEYKKFKKAEYVSDSIFVKLINGLSEKELFNDYRNESIKIEGKMLLTKEDKERFFKDSKPAYKIESVQKNSIDRLTMSTGEEGQTFYQQEYFTSPVFKLHFLIKTDDINLFKPVFRYLEDKGIGGNRSTGKGRFKIEVVKEVSIGNKISSKFVALSRYIPEITEVTPILYEIFPWRSKVESEAEFKGEDVWKARVMYLKEGSIFEAKERKEFYGRLPVVKEIEGQKIYQNGITFPAFGNFGDSK